MTSAEALGASANVSSPVGRRVRVPKMAELVAAHLRRQIVRGELADDEALPSEGELMAQFNISRPTLREALRVLESESLITVRRGPRGGARAQPPRFEVAARYAGLILQHNGTTLADLLQVRVVVEPRAAAQLARGRTRSDLARLRAALGRGEDSSTSPIEAMHRFEALHTLIVELTRNETLSVLMGMLSHIVELADSARVQSDDARGFENMRRATEMTHARVVDMIEARDAVGAEKLWRKHLVAGNDYVLRGADKTVLDVLG